MQLVSRNTEEFLQHAITFGRGLTPWKDTATVIALSGDLGAGKTMWVQSIARTFGITENVSSPTFVIEKVYEIPMMGFRNLSSEKDIVSPFFERLVHIDAYRLKSEGELVALGWHEIARDLNNLVFIEWPEQVPALIPPHAIRIRFDITGEGRIITIDDGKKEGSKSTNE